MRPRSRKLRRSSARLAANKGSGTQAYSARICFSYSETRPSACPKIVRSMSITIAPRSFSDRCSGSGLHVRIEEGGLDTTVSFDLHPDAIPARAGEFVGEDDGVAFLGQTADNFQVLIAGLGAFPLDETLLRSHGDVAEGMEVREHSPIVAFNDCMALHSEVRFEDGWRIIAFDDPKTKRCLGPHD